MPEAVMFNYLNKVRTVFFSQANAMLPVKLKTGEIKLVAWGRREGENSEMPLGGWARLNSIRNEKNTQWNLYLPAKMWLNRINSFAVYFGMAA